MYGRISIVIKQTDWSGEGPQSLDLVPGVNQSARVSSQIRRIKLHSWKLLQLILFYQSYQKQPRATLAADVLSVSNILRFSRKNHLIRGFQTFPQHDTEPAERPIVAPYADLSRKFFVSDEVFEDSTY